MVDVTAPLPPLPDPPTPTCTAGWAEDPCFARAVSGCEIDGLPACRECFEEERAYWVPEGET